VREVVAQVPVEEILEGAEEKRAGAARGIEDAQPLDLLRGLAIDQRADGLADDIIDDVSGRVVDAAGFADLGLFLDDGAVALGQADDLAQKLLIDLPRISAETTENS